MNLIEREVSVLNLPTEVVQEKKREEAFSNQYSWRGKEFDGLTSARKDVWMTLTHKAGFVPMEDVGDSPELFIPLAKAIIFVCILPKAELKRLRTQGQAALIDAFEDWCDKNVPINMEAEAFTLGLKVWSDATANQAEVLPSEGAGVGKS